MLKLILLLAFSTTAFAQHPQLKNAKVQELAASGPLQQQIESLASRQSGTAWIGYSVPAVPSNRTICCFSDGWQEHTCCGTCHLDGSDDHGFSGSRDNCDDEDEVKNVFVFYKVEEKKVENIRLFTPKCALDAGGLPVLWIDKVDARQSVVYLTSFVSKDEDSRMSRRAINAIAEHADTSADTALDRFAGAGYQEKTREHAAFWLGIDRGAPGYATLKRLIESDPSDNFREHLTFPISQSKEPQAQDELIRVAKQDVSPRVRGQALFWLAQKAGKKVAGVISDAIENDPNTDVKKRAVFALSQLPDHEGVPKLIEVAKTNKNPVVRKQAVFWLGQSGDPRALEFIENVLTGGTAR